MFVVLISKVSWALVGFPLYTLYRQGPAMIGCWQGRTDDEVCAELSNTESSFWRLNRHQCGEMIEKKFNSVYVVVTIFLYCYILLTMLNIATRVFFIRWASPPSSIIFSPRQDSFEAFSSLSKGDSISRTYSCQSSPRRRSSSEQRRR